MWLRYSSDDRAGVGIVVVVIVIAIAVMLLLTLAVPTVYIQKVEAKITLTDINGSPIIDDYNFKKHDFTYYDWLLHEREKLEMVSPKYELTFWICDIPPSTDCDSDSARFNWAGDDMTISLTAPTFVGKREFTIRLTDLDTGAVIDEVVEWHRF